MEESLGLDEFLQTFVDFIYQVFEVRGCLLLRSHADKKQRTIYTCPATQVEKKFPKFCSNLLENYESTLKEGRSIIVSRASHSYPLVLENIFSGDRPHSLAIVPLSHKELYFGGIFMYHAIAEHQWQEDELNSINHFADRCARTLYRYQWFDRRDSINESAGVSFHQWQRHLTQTIDRKLNSSLDSQQVLADILKIIGESLEVDRAIVVQVNETEKNSLYEQWNDEKTLAELPAFNIDDFSELEIPDSKEEKSIRQFCPFINLSKDRTLVKKYVVLEQRNLPACCYLIKPIFVREIFFGLLILQTSLPLRTFKDEEIETIDSIADRIAIALYHCQHQQTLAKLEQEKAAAEAAVQIKSEVLSYMNHELRNPLAGVLGFARMLKDEIYGSLNEKQMQYVTTIEDCGEHVLALVNNFLDISRIEANREELLLEKVVVEEICRASIAIVGEQAREKKLALNLEIASDIDFCTVDRIRVKQILVNLLSNAIKFTEVGSVTLKVYRDLPNNDSSQGICLKFDVIDTGIGIKEADRGKLFQAFQQIQSPLSRKYKGTGLGLALSRKLANLHGGDLTLISAEGKGSCFSLNLPIQPLDDL